MTSPKAQYRGDGSGELVRDFSDNLRDKLRGYYPDQQAEQKAKQEAKDDPIQAEVYSTFGYPADDFVSRVLNAASSAISKMHWQKLDSTKQDIRAEHTDLLRTLQGLHHKLTHLSPDYERLLGIDADYLGCADKVSELASHVEAAGPRIANLPTAKKPAQKQDAIMARMTIDVLRVLMDFGIAPAATADKDLGYSSHAVQILKAIGDDIGLVRAAVTWRDTIIAVKKITPDLQ